MADYFIRYQPHEQQKIFHTNPEGYRYRVALSGYRGGKSVAGIFEHVKRRLEYPRSVGWMGEPTFQMVNQILFPILEGPLILDLQPGEDLKDSPLISRVNHQKKRIDWHNGSVSWWGSMEVPTRAEGGTWDDFYLDEARLVRHFDTAWKTLTGRLSGTGARHIRTGFKIRPCGWITSTGTPRGTPFYMKVADPIERHPNVGVYSWMQPDNPYLDEDYLEDQRGEHRLEGDKTVFIDGGWSDLGIGSYEYDFNRHVLRGEMPLPKEQWNKIIYGVDWGWTAPMAIIVIIFDKDDRAYIIDEFYKVKQGDKKILTAFQEFYKKYGKGTAWADPEEPKTISYLRDHGIDVRGNATKRKEGIREVGGRFPDAGDGKPRIYILSKCKNTLQEVADYDTDKKENDHAMDAIRYGIINGKAQRKRIFGVVRRR